MKSEQPRILFLDVETQPDLVWTWGVYQENAIAVKEHWQLLSFSAEWLGGGTITLGRDDFPGRDDKELTKALWQLLDEADIVVAHNGISFDLKKITARFIAHRLPKPSPYKIVDTKVELKKVAAFSSNKLDWMAKQLGLGEKKKHEGWPLWEGCINGDAACWKRMKSYNRHDVILLKKLYLELQPWMEQPNAGLWSGELRCPNPACGSAMLQKRGVQRSKTRMYQRFQCAKCGAWSRAVKSEKTKAQIVGLS